MGFPVTIQTRFGALFAGHRTNHTARGKHARVETGRNMPGTPGKCPSTLNYATSCRTRPNAMNSEQKSLNSLSCKFRRNQAK